MPLLHVTEHSLQNVVAFQELGRLALTLHSNCYCKRVVRPDVDVLLVVGIYEAVRRDVCVYGFLYVRVGI